MALASAAPHELSAAALHTACGRSPMPVCHVLQLDLSWCRLLPRWAAQHVRMTACGALGAGAALVPGQRHDN